MIGKTNADTNGNSLSTECTATTEQVLSGYTAVTKNSNDNAISGTMRNRDFIDSSIGGISNAYPSVAIHKGTNSQINVTTNSKKSLFAIAPPNGFYGTTLEY